jgi:hypothetical protein
VLVLDGIIKSGFEFQEEGQTLMTQTSSDYLSFAVSKASGHKCARCWNFMPAVGDYGIWRDVCTRCQGALKEMNIDPPQPAEEAQ